MSKAPSMETQLRNAQREWVYYEKRCEQVSAAHDAWKMRAVKAEQELAEWKSRFDKLLERTPKEAP